MKHRVSSARNILSVAPFHWRSYTDGGSISSFLDAIPRFTSSSTGWPATDLPASVLQLRVWNGKRYRELQYCLPLQTGDEVQLRIDSPTGFHGLLLWAGPDGVVHSLGTSDPNQPSRTLIYPEIGKAVPLAGRAGTEFVVFCARHDRTPNANALRERLAKVKHWPTLPGNSILRVNRDKVIVENTARGPGQAIARDDPEGTVTDRVEELRRELLGECELLAGVVFSHD